MFVKDCKKDKENKKTKKKKKFKYKEAMLVLSEWWRSADV
jgi:hypothetical protein